MPRRPHMFIGSSVEGKQIAETIQLNLEYDVDCTVWHQGVFGLGGGTLETLVQLAKQFDFATLVLTADDLVARRGKTAPAARDNVIFELGLFVGALGRERTFMVYSRRNPPALPSDLAGITAATYEESENLEASLGPVCTRLKAAIRRVSERRR